MERVALIRLNREQTLNALTPRMLADIRELRIQVTGYAVSFLGAGGRTRADTLGGPRF